MTLYEDLQYTVKHVDSVEHARKRQRRVAAQTAVNENGEASPAGGPTAAGRNTTQEPPPQQKLKAGEKKKLAKKQELLSTKRLQLLDVMEKADKYRAMIPEYVLEAGKKAGAQALEAREKLEVAKKGGTDVFNSLQELADGALEELAQADKRLKLQVEQAAAFGS